MAAEQTPQFTVEEPDQQAHPQGQPTQAAPAQQFTVEEPQDEQSQQPATGKLSLDSNIMDKVSGAVTGVGMGAVKGFGSNATGIAEMIHKIPGGIGEKLVPSEGLSAMQEATTPHGTAEQIGFGGETLLEFIMGDELLKGLTLSKKLDAAGKIASQLEKSPRILDALKRGAAGAARMGVVGGAQTLVRSGGDVKEAAESGAANAALGGAIGIPAEAAGAIGAKMTEGLEGNKILKEIASKAPERPQIVQDVSDLIGKADKVMHTRFQEGIDDVKNWLPGQIDHAGSPLHKAAEDFSGASENSDPHLKVLKETSPVSSDAKKVLENIQELAQPDKTVGKEKIMGESYEMKVPQDPHKLDVDTLIKYRQAYTKRLLRPQDGGLPWDSPDRAMYSKLVDGVDDSIESIAKKKLAEDPDNPYAKRAVDRYAGIRTQYRETKELFRNKVVKNLLEGNLKDAGDELLSGKKDNVYPVKKLVGPQNMGKLGDEIFARQVADAGGDPAKVVSWWENINRNGRNQEVLDELFNIDDARSTPSFRNWFGKSKAGDELGNAKVLYHGTRGPDFDVFDTEGGGGYYDDASGEFVPTGSSADSYMGSHFTEEKKTADYFAQGKGWTSSRPEHPMSKPRVEPVYLKVTNPKDFGPEVNMHDFINEGSINDENVLQTAMESDGITDPYGPEGEEWFKRYDKDAGFRKKTNQWLMSQDNHEAAQQLAQDAKARLQKQGFDGVKYENSVEGGKAWIAFDANQIKSASRNVAFDPGSDSISDTGKKPAFKVVEEVLADAKNAAAVQKLIKYGLISATSAAVGHTIGGHYGVGTLGTFLGLVGGVGGTAAAGDYLNWISDHPTTWRLFAKAPTVAGAIGKPAAKLAGGAVQVGMNMPKSNDSKPLRDALQGFSLSGNQ